MGWACPEFLSTVYNFEILSFCHEQSLVSPCLPFQCLKPLSSPFAPARQQPSRSKAKTFPFATSSFLHHLLHFPLGSVKSLFFSTPLLSQPPIRVLPSTSFAAPSYTSKVSSAEAGHQLCYEVPLPSVAPHPFTSKVSQVYSITVRVISSFLKPMEVCWTSSSI